MPALCLKQALEPRQVQVTELGPQQALPSELGWGLVERAESVPAKGQDSERGQAGLRGA